MTGDECPEDVAAALDAAPDAKARFERLPPSHRQEYLKWVQEAKKPETRARRVRGMVEKLVEPKRVG
jgi:uncharacterized protein YdeI (YjbR/CyaY-like superfamily)